MAERYGNPKTPEQLQQEQLHAKLFGLDLATMQEYAQNPRAFDEKYGKYRDKTTGVFNIPDVTPGALVGAPHGPNGTVLGAGFTKDNPIDLAGLKRNTVTPGSVTMLPPYMQPGAQHGTFQGDVIDGNSLPQANTNVPGPGAVAPVTQPTPAPTSSVAPSNPFGLKEKPAIDFPYYLRNAKKKRGVGGIVAYG